MAIHNLRELPWPQCSFSDTGQCSGAGREEGLPHSTTHLTEYQPKLPTLPCDSHKAYGTDEESGRGNSTGSQNSAPTPTQGGSDEVIQGEQKNICCGGKSRGRALPQWYMKEFTSRRRSRPGPLTGTSGSMAVDRPKTGKNFQAMTVGSYTLGNTKIALMRRETVHLADKNEWNEEKAIVHTYVGPRQHQPEIKP
ncbi:hypothetical protein AVEN_146842-1 [Araneus ventricosus]|uniref:Uncharacterized protein n=1 Tax=Araneus ventricosus TaxID=182803 RepID=A0A4Y2C6M6_ARAVE|nr:hypothetical protein AVEN_146842-1 [Araneus ventricosus]